MTNDSNSSKETKIKKTSDTDLVKLKENLDALNTFARENDIVMSTTHIASIFSLSKNDSD